MFVKFFWLENCVLKKQNRFVLFFFLYNDVRVIVLSKLFKNYFAVLMQSTYLSYIILS